MRTNLLAAAAAAVAIASPASGSVIWRDDGAADVVWVTNVQVVTVYECETEHPSYQHQGLIASATASTASAVSTASTASDEPSSTVPVAPTLASAVSNAAYMTGNSQDDPKSYGQSSSYDSIQGDAMTLPPSKSAQRSSRSPVASPSSGAQLPTSPVPAFSSSMASVSNLDSSSAAVSAAPAHPRPTTNPEPGLDTPAPVMAPNGKKAGLSGFVGVQRLDAFKQLAPHISWYSDYTPNPPDVDNVKGVGMLWGADGSPCGDGVSKRVKMFEETVAGGSPDIMFGFYEPDCYCGDSSQMSSSAGTHEWNRLLAPLGRKGTVLGSPSMCKQKDEDWLQPFIEGGLAHDWDVTSIHINEPDLDGVKADIEYYVSTYKKPIWVSEFACVHAHGSWLPCTNQSEINQFIHEAVRYFESNDSVVAYGPSNGNGLGNVWPLLTADGSLTETGQTYLNAVKDL